MRRLALAALALCGLTSAALAAEPNVILPDWVRKPTPEEVWWAYPQAARKAIVEGKATIRCMVDETGNPQLCVILSEEPAGMGFGQAAVSLRTSMKFRPKTVDGKYVPDEVTIPVNFTLEPELLPSPPEAPLSARQRALAQELIALLRQDEMTKRMLEEALKTVLFEGAGTLDAEERRIISDSVNEAIARIQAKIPNAIASDLVRGFTEAEFEKVVAFFKTPEGKKFARLQLRANPEDRVALRVLMSDLVIDANKGICRRSQAVCRKVDYRGPGAAAPR